MRVKIKALEDEKVKEAVAKHLFTHFVWELKDLWLDIDGPHREALKMKIMVSAKVPGQSTLHKYQISRGNFAKFIDHCGISSVQGVNVCSALGEIWMNLIEDFLYQNEYSAIIAADTESLTYNFIKTYGKHWNVASKPFWINRRMGSSHPLRILVRYLNEHPPEKMGNLAR